MPLNCWTRSLDRLYSGTAPLNVRQGLPQQVSPRELSQRSIMSGQQTRQIDQGRLGLVMRQNYFGTEGTGETLLFLTVRRHSDGQGAQICCSEWPHLFSIFFRVLSTIR